MRVIYKIQKIISICKSKQLIKVSELFKALFLKRAKLFNDFFHSGGPRGSVRLVLTKTTPFMLHSRPSLAKIILTTNDMADNYIRA